MAVCIVVFAVASPKVDCCSLCRKSPAKVNSSKRIGSTAAQHPHPTEDDCCDNAKIIDRAHDEMDSIKLSKRGTEYERTLSPRWLGRHRNFPTATADSARQGAGYDCFALSGVVRCLLDVDSAVRTREMAGTYLLRSRGCTGQPSWLGQHARGMRKVSLVVSSLLSTAHPE